MGTYIYIYCSESGARNPTLLYIYGKSHRRVPALARTRSSRCHLAGVPVARRARLHDERTPLHDNSAVGSDHRGDRAQRRRAALRERENGVHFADKRRFCVATVRRRVGCVLVHAADPPRLERARVRTAIAVLMVRVVAVLHACEYIYIQRPSQTDQLRVSGRNASSQHRSTAPTGLTSPCCASLTPSPHNSGAAFTDGDGVGVGDTVRQCAALNATKANTTITRRASVS